MDQPLLLMFGMIVISTLLFVLSRNLCRDPEAIHAEVEREQQRALAEAMVRNMDTHELVAIASGRVSAGLTGTNRGQQRSRAAVDEEQRAGISEETRMSFVKLSAGRSGHAPEVVSSHRADISHDGEISLQARPKSANRSGSAERLDDVPLSSSSSMAEPVGPPSEGIFSVVREEAAKAMEPVSEPIEVPSGAYSDNTCSICLDDYEEGDQLLQLTCGHVFHRPCIDLWLKSHRVCPCCRTDLDQLAQVAQVFPTRGRRSLQKALARAEGNIAAAVELLLSQERNSEAVDRVVDTGEAFSPSQAFGRAVGTRRVPVADSIGDHGSPFGHPNGTLVERTVLGDGYASGATSSDGDRTRNAFRRRAEYRPGFPMADTIRHTYMRTIAREAEPENATNAPMVSHAPLPTVIENPVEETVDDRMRPRQAVVTVVSRSLTESSSQATASREERGSVAENPPPVGVSEAQGLTGARGSNTCRLPRPSAIMRIGKRYPSAAGNVSSVSDARVSPSAADMASGLRRPLAPPSYAEAMSEIATRRPAVFPRVGSSSIAGEDAMGGGSSGVEVEAASGVRGEGVTSPAAESRVSAE